MHQEHGAPPAGTVTVVMAEGRRLIRLGRELSSSIFDALISEYQRLTRDVMERMGGRQFEVFQDTAIAAFPTAKQAALAAAALQHVVATHEWPHKGDVAVSGSRTDLAKGFRRRVPGGVGSEQPCERGRAETDRERAAVGGW